MQNPYQRFDLRYLFGVTVALILISAALLPSIPKGVDFKGGLLITAQAPGNVDKDGLHAALTPFSDDIEVRTSLKPDGTSGLEIQMGLNPRLQQASDVALTLREDERAWLLALAQTSSATGTPKPDAAKTEEAAVRATAAKLLTLSGSTQPLPASTEDASRVAQDAFEQARSDERTKILSAIRPYAQSDSVAFREIGSSLSQFFVAQTTNILIVSFLLAGLVIFIVLRSAIASATVIYGAVGTLVITGGAMAIFGVQLSLATIAAMLLLIGLSLDTAATLTIRVYKRSGGTAAQRAYDSFTTVGLMNAANIAAFAVLAVAGYVWKIGVYQDIGTVVVIGACADLIMTWFGNAPLILWYVDRKERKRAALGF